MLVLSTKTGKNSRQQRREGYKRARRNQKNRNPKKGGVTKRKIDSY